VPPTASWFLARLSFNLTMEATDLSETSVQMQDYSFLINFCRSDFCDLMKALFLKMFLKAPRTTSLFLARLSLTLKMEAVTSSKTSVQIQTIRRYILRLLLF
jgi:hypothetical protein